MSNYFGIHRAETIGSDHPEAKAARKAAVEAHQAAEKAAQDGPALAPADRVRSGGYGHVGAMRFVNGQAEVTSPTGMVAKEQIAAGRDAFLLAPSIMESAHEPLSGRASIDIGPRSLVIVNGVQTSVAAAVAAGYIARDPVTGTYRETGAHLQAPEQAAPDAKE